MANITALGCVFFSIGFIVFRFQVENTCWTNRTSATTKLSRVTMIVGLLLALFGLVGVHFN